MTDLNDIFANLESDTLESIINAPKGTAKQPPASYKPGFTESCPACRGSGKFVSYSGRIVGDCFKCKGKGSKTFKSSPQARQANRQKIADKKADRIEAFKTEYASEYEWIVNNVSWNSFAISMNESLAKYGSLTDGQIGAIRKCILKAEARQAEKQARIENAPTLDITPITEAFAKASAKLSKPVLRLDRFVISHASAMGKNPGALYVKEGDLYLGKIQNGKFFATRACNETTVNDVLVACSAPKDATIRYGRLTGRCGCCGRTLENAESIARGIGPICAEKYGW